MGQGSSVRVAMAMAVPMTLEGGKKVKGHRLRRMVQLSPWRPRHSGAPKILRSQEKRREVGGGRTLQASFWKEEKKKTRPFVGV